MRAHPPWRMGGAFSQKGGMLATEVAYPVGVLAEAWPVDAPPAAKFLEVAEAIGRALGRRPWVARRPAGWQVYCLYQGEDITGDMHWALSVAVWPYANSQTRWSRSQWQDAVRITVSVYVPADGSLTNPHSPRLLPGL